MQKIQAGSFKNIIFDLGGVILNIDYKLTINCFKTLGISNFDLIYSQAQQNLLFDQYEKGEVSSKYFIEEIQKKCHHSTSVEAIIKAWNAMLLDIPEDRLLFLSTLKKNHRLFLLSNTNDIHKRAYSDYLKKTYGFEDFSEYFERQYLSFEIGMRKPHPEVFNHVLDKNGLNASETVFIDDSAQHIKGAASVGIKAVHLTGEKTILDLFC